MPYTPTTWVNGSTPPLSAANLNHIELGLQAAYPVYNVRDSAYGAVGNGVADDTTALQAAITAAAGGGIVYSPPGYTYLISSPLTITASCVFDFSLSTIKKSASYTAALAAANSGIYITGGTVIMRRLKIDGNRANSATNAGCWINASGVVALMHEVTFSHNAYHGIVVDAGATCDFVDCEASDNSGSGTGNGFHINASGSLGRFYGRCYAASNNNAGFYIEAGAADGCRLEGRAYQNFLAGAQVLSNRGHCPFFIADQSNQFGLMVGTNLATTVSYWTFDYVEANDNGVAIPGHAMSITGTGVELFGADHCSFGTIITRGSTGYGLSVSQNATTGSTYNTFHSVTCDQAGAGDTDPGINVSGGSMNNEFGNVVVRRHSVGITVGEASGGNHYNVFGNVYLNKLPWGGITIDGGDHNSFQNVIARDVYNSDLTLFSKGVVSFVGAAGFGGTSSVGNVVGFLDNDATGSDMATVPGDLVYADASATGNMVLDGFSRASQVGANDLNGNNYFYLRRVARRTSLSTFDSGETWSNSTNNTVNGQFVEGNGSKKVTGGTSAHTFSVRTGLSLNLSTTAATDWFRFYAYITNQADFGGFTTAIQFAMMTDASNYFYWNFPANALKDGSNWLTVRKGGMGLQGSPVWTSITRIQFAVWGTTSISTVSFDDLSIAETKWDRTSTIGQSNTPAVITVGASPFLYQNTDGVPLNVMVSGGTVSAIDYSQDANTFYSQGQTAGIFIVNPGDYTQVTYSVAPTMTKVPTR